MSDPRIVTALTLMPLVIAVTVYGSAQVFAGLSAIVVLSGAWEWAGLAGFRQKWQKILFLFVHIISFSSLLSCREYRFIIVDSGGCRGLVGTGRDIDNSSGKGQKIKPCAIIAAVYLRHCPCSRMAGPGGAAFHPGVWRPHLGIMSFHIDLVC